MANRRGFLLGIGAALAAPAIVRADSLMKIATVRESMPAIKCTEHFIELPYALTERTVTEVFMQLERHRIIGIRPTLLLVPEWQSLLSMMEEAHAR